MKIDELIATFYYLIDCLDYFREVSNVPDCNNCGKKRTCKYVPAWGDLVRINCSMWEADDGVKLETVPSDDFWYPVSDVMPNVDETNVDETSEYLVTDKDGRVRHCYLDPYMPETFITVEEGMIVDAVAWRPAPEPYCKTESHEREGE